MLMESDLPVSYSSFNDEEGTHYTLMMDIGWLTERATYGDIINLHYTMECGNDKLAGQFKNDVPESYNIGWIVGMTMVFMAIFRRKL
jgi:hypothetical protein